MKKFTIEVSHASPAQLQTIAAELKIMSNNWERFGPRIVINGQKLQAPELHEPRTKRQATSSKRHNIAMFR
jgi:hypothetical protein